MSIDPPDFHPPRPCNTLFSRRNPDHQFSHPDTLALSNAEIVAEDAFNVDRKQQMKIKLETR